MFRYLSNSGGLVGNLPIRGDVSEGASKGIKLRLVKGTEYVELRQSSKDLLLRKPLDRDEVFHFQIFGIFMLR